MKEQELKFLPKDKVYTSPMTSKDELKRKVIDNIYNK